MKMSHRARQGGGFLLLSPCTVCAPLPAPASEKAPDSSHLCPRFRAAASQVWLSRTGSADAGRISVELSPTYLQSQKTSTSKHFFISVEISPRKKEIKITKMKSKKKKKKSRNLNFKAPPILTFSWILSFLLAHLRFHLKQS